MPMLANIKGSSMQKRILINLKESPRPHLALYNLLEEDFKDAANVIKAKLGTEKTQEYFDLIAQVKVNLKMGMYHDFISEEGDLKRGGPKMIMVDDLRRLGGIYKEIAEFVIDGLFDEHSGTDWKNERLI